MQLGRVIGQYLPGHVDQIKPVRIDLSQLIRGLGQSVPSLSQTRVTVRRAARRVVQGWRPFNDRSAMVLTV